MYVCLSRVSQAHVRLRDTCGTAKLVRKSLAQILPRYQGLSYCLGVKTNGSLRP